MLRSRLQASSRPHDHMQLQPTRWGSGSLKLCRQHARPLLAQLHAASAVQPQLLQQLRPAGCRCPPQHAASPSAEEGAITSEDDMVRVATVGDVVSIHFTCKDQEGNVLESSREQGEPLSFELGAGDIMGNRLFKGFDEAIRGLAVGQMTVIEAVGGEWQRELLFSIPRDHPEIERLEGRYKNQGGLQKDMLVELANGALAVVVDLDESTVKIDANNMMAGKSLVFELEVLAIDKPKPEEL